MTSPRKRIATYAVAGAAAVSGGIGGLLLAVGPGASAQTTDPSTTVPATPHAPGTDSGPRGGVTRPDDVAVAAQAIGMTTEELRTQLQAGKTIAAVAQERGVDVQKVIDAIVAADTKAVDEAFAAGRITQAQADAKKAGLAAHVKEEVERVGFGRPGGDRPHPAGAPSTSATPATVTTD